METQECANCNTQIGKTETICPNCKVNLEELEDAISTVDRAQTILEKRRKAALPPVPPVVQPPVKRNVLASLGKVIRSK